MADELALSALLLSAAGTLVDQIHRGMVQRGYLDLRPIHGYVLARCAPAGATNGAIAEHLGVTKQAASQLVDEMVDRGLVERQDHPADARAKLVVLTERGWTCTRAADEAATEAISGWVDVLGQRRVSAIVADLRRVARPGHLRPTVW
ncbi:MarR family winged helix-turn-helix transcriptional regulator [Cryptosporangium phraense]|uniref:Winged helix-turn-helix transcriptional regulator n=1 Tax=Cryptosporangium phraense TaxID=2593070 RepID=A0A545AM67_9ACTN|nr:MarR family winged helix-turn-helix transcriptional regulator [Cryptosporangium phraense]TQS42414.1 winged helix-turn-helix transcriptional regulator [Cryptosporangium phraense]